MKSGPPFRFKKWMTVGGCFLMMLPTGIPWCWGNIGMYALSYTAMHGQNKAGVDTPWVISIYFLCNMVGIYLYGLSRTPTAKFIAASSAALLFSGGICLTYWTVQVSVFMVTFSIGVMSGIGGGMINGMALRYSGTWADKDVCFVTCVIQSAYCGGNIFINPLVSTFVNPENHSPDTEINSVKLFTQPEVLDKVPIVFIMFGATSFVLFVVSFACVKEKGDEDPEESQLVEASVRISDVESVRKEEDSTKATFSGKENPDKSLNDVVKTSSFYSLLALFALFESAVTTLLNYYKDYGVIWIEDDLFLAKLGMPFVVFAGVGYVVWGFISDRIGLKKAQVCLTSTTTVCFLFMYFTPMLNRWLYAFNLLILGFQLTPMFSILAVTTRTLFGKTHFITNLFYVTIAAVVFDFLTPLILQALLTVGWFCVFFFGSFLCFVSLIIIVVTLPPI